MIYAAVLAGGTGSRMGADRPKQFLEFAGRPVIVHTTEKFLRHEEIDRVIVITPADWCSYTEDLLAGCFGRDGRIIVAAGGETRNETLMNAVAVIEQEGELDEDTIQYNVAKNNGELTYVYRSLKRDLENVDWKEFSENVKGMTTAERMFFAYDEETGELLMNEAETRTLKVDAVNGPYVLVVTSGLMTDTGFHEMSNENNSTAQEIIQTFQDYGK